MEILKDRGRNRNSEFDFDKTPGTARRMVGKRWCVERNPSNLSRYRRDPFLPDNADTIKNCLNDDV